MVEELEDFIEMVFANQLKTVLKLISGDLGTKVYMVRLSGFDTHNAQVQGIGNPEGNHHKLLMNLSEVIEVSFIDLDNQNLSDDVVGLTFSEFGRKAAENGNFGTDHSEIAPMVVVGKPVENGVSGNNPDLSEATSDNNFQIKTVQYDYRQTISTLLQDFTGVSNNVIDSTFFNYSLNNSFTDLKIDKLIKPSFTVQEFCLVNSYGDVGIYIPDVKEFESLVYPNPFTNYLTINSIEQQENIAYKLFYTNSNLMINGVKPTEYWELKIY